MYKKNDINTKQRQIPLFQIQHEIIPAMIYLHIKIGDMA